MRTAAISELKSRLSEYLDVVRAGEELGVTDRGKLIARLQPVSSELDSTSDLVELERLGLAKLPTTPLHVEAFFALPRASDPGGRALAALLADREEGT